MSTLKADTIVAADGTSPVTLTKQSAAKAWVSVDHQGDGAGTTTGNPTVINSLNQSSYTDEAGGIGTIGFANSMSAADFAVNVTGTNNRSYNANGLTLACVASNLKNPYLTTNDVRIMVGHLANGAGHDAAGVRISTCIHGDLA